MKHLIGCAVFRHPVETLPGAPKAMHGKGGGVWVFTLQCVPSKQTSWSEVTFSLFPPNTQMDFSLLELRRNSYPNSDFNGFLLLLFSSENSDSSHGVRTLDLYTYLYLHTNLIGPSYKVTLVFILKNGNFKPIW